MKTKKQDLLLEGTCFLFIGLVFVFTLKALSFLFIPFCIALLLCYALGLPLDFLQRHHVPFVIRTLLTIFLIIGGAYGIGRVLQINLFELKNSLPTLEARFWDYTTLLLTRLEMTPAEVQEIFKAFTANIGKEDLKPLGTMLHWLSGSFFSFLGNLFWVLLFVAFILSERSAIARKIVTAWGPEKAINILDVMVRINRAVQQYLGLKSGISLITGILVGVVLTLTGAPFPFLWGVVAFLFNFIPNVGSFLAGIPPVMLTLFTSGSLLHTLVVLIAFIFTQLIMGNIVEPRIMGQRLGLSPLIVLLSLLFWGWLWGIAGMLLSVPLTAAIRIALEQIEQTQPIAILMGNGETKAAPR